MVRDHFAVLKVGPGLTFALRETLFALDAIEREWLAGRPGVVISRLRETLQRVMVEHPEHWQPYFRGEEDQLRFARDFSLSDRSRYYWPQAEVRASIGHLVDNLSARPIPLALLSQYLPIQYRAVREGTLENSPRALIRAGIGAVIDDYARACGMTGRQPSHPSQTLGLNGDVAAPALRGPMTVSSDKIPAPLTFRAASPEAAAAESVAALEDTILRIGAERVLAFVMEPIGGQASGVNVPPPSFARAVRRTATAMASTSCSTRSSRRSGPDGSWPRITTPRLDLMWSSWPRASEPGMPRSAHSSRPQLRSMRWRSPRVSSSHIRTMPTPWRAQLARPYSTKWSIEA